MIGGSALLLAIIVYILRGILRSPAFLFVIFIAVVFVGAALDDSRWFAAAGVVAVFWVVALVLKRRANRRIEFVVEGVEAPARPRRKKNPPELTPERMFRQCAKILGGKVADCDALRDEISRMMNSAKFSDWTLANNEVYFDDATPRQVGYLQALGYTGKQPRYLGDASFLIECMLVVKSYRERLTSALSSPVSSDVRANYIALWNSATAAGVLSKRDATELLKVIMSSPDSAARHALISAISDYLAAPDIAEIPTDLFTLSESWLAAQ